MIKKAMIFVCALVILLISDISFAQAEGSLSSRSGRWNVGGCIGMTFDPDMTAMLVGVDYYVTNEIAVGPLLLGALDGGKSMWGVSGMAKYSARLAENEMVRPYGQAGVGFINLALGNDGHSSTEFLFPVGGGFEFELNDDLTLDVNALFIISDITSAGLFAGVKYLF